jgi:hypothetical protein
MEHSYHMPLDPSPKHLSVKSFSRYTTALCLCLPLPHPSHPPTRKTTHSFTLHSLTAHPHQTRPTHTTSMHLPRVVFVKKGDLLSKTTFFPLFSPNLFVVPVHRLFSNNKYKQIPLKRYNSVRQNFKPYTVL